MPNPDHNHFQNTTISKTQPESKERQMTQTETTPEELNPCEQTLCHRMVTLVSGAVGRALKECGEPLDDEKVKATEGFVFTEVSLFIFKLREEPAGVPVERQDYLIGWITLAALRAVWGLEPREPTPEERRENFRVLN